MSRDIKITCDICHKDINWKYYDSLLDIGAIEIRARQLRRVLDNGGLLKNAWKREKYHIYPLCINKIRYYCKERNAGAHEGG